MTHTLHPAIERALERRAAPLKILQVGAGGNGSKLLMGLHHLHQALTAYGFAGLHVTLADGDTVSESNLARQSFWPSDLGSNKAVTLINRLNLAAGYGWRAIPEHITDPHDLHTDILISCVDTRAARHALARLATSNTYRAPIYWLDLGNGARGGQTVLGQPKNHHNPAKRERLRCAHELFPSIIDTTTPDDDTPSCGTIEALERQDLMLNDLLAVQSVNLLWNLLRYRALDTHGVFVTSTTGLCTPIPIDPGLWRRLARGDAHRSARASRADTARARAASTGAGRRAAREATG